MKLALAFTVLMLAQGCALTSRATWARSQLAVGERQRLGVGEAHTVRLTYPSAGEDIVPPRIDVRCDGAPCKVSEPEIAIHPGADDLALLDVEFLAVGEASIDVTISDSNTLSWRYGPFTVLEADRLSTTCRVTRAGVQRACDGGVLPSDSVRIEFGVFAGSERFVHKNLVVNAAAPWACALSSASDDGLGPVWACTATALPPSSQQTLGVSLGALTTEARIAVAAQ